MKKILAGIMALTMLASATACDKEGKNGKTVINLYAFTDEVPGMIDKYMELHPDVAKKYEIKATQ
ncbi:MAG: carbohydrate ABC transporter substrate-binding protein, partial [Ruminococcus sp.]|nr:carbohydrate ABC transporter substrate-binding protein [Ruminococcus sp.]